ncbi:MAG: protease inhibitor I42 family protein [Coriobacteriales bacterium]|nr:protease inhibitor I42 family protein [Coriobacteriales bacterium]
MKRQIQIVVVAVVIAGVCLVAAGCAPYGPSNDGARTDGTTTESPITTGTSTNPEPPGPLELTEADSGSTQEMQTGQLAVITLDANPSTGYEWQVDGEVPAQLAQSGEPEFEAESDAIGAGGKERWSFMAKETGEGTLKLIWLRPWEKDTPPAKTFEVKVSVR